MLNLQIFQEVMLFLKHHQVYALFLFELSVHGSLLMDLIFLHLLGLNLIQSSELKSLNGIHNLFDDYAILQKRMFVLKRGNKVYWFFALGK